MEILFFFSTDGEDMETMGSNDDDSIQLHLSESDSSLHSILETEEIKNVSEDSLPTPLLSEPSVNISFSANTAHQPQTSNILKHSTPSDGLICDEIIEVTTVVKKEVSFTEVQDIDTTSDEDMICSEDTDVEFKIPSPPTSPLYRGLQTSKVSQDPPLVTYTSDYHQEDPPSQIKPIVTKTVSTDRPLQVEIPQMSTVSPQLSPRRSPRLQLKSPKVGTYTFLLKSDI